MFSSACPDFDGCARLRPSIAASVVLWLASSAVGIELRGKASSNTTASLAPQRMFLPDVSAVFKSRSAKRLNVFKQITQDLQREVARQQSVHEKSISSRKAELEAQLNQQAKRNDDVTKANQDLKKRIRETQEILHDERHEAFQIDKGNGIILETMQDLEKKLRMAADFLADTRLTGREHREEGIKVLREGGATPSLSRFLLMANSTQSHIAAPRATMPLKLLQEVFLPRAAQLSDSGGIAENLTQSFADIVDAEQEAEAQIEADFQKYFQEGQRRYDVLMQEQAQLNKTMDAMQSRFEQTAKANQEAVDLQSMLRQRLHGVRVFVRKIDAEAVQTFRLADTTEPVNPSAGPDRSAAHNPSAPPAADGH